MRRTREQRGIERIRGVHRSVLQCVVWGLGSLVFALPTAAQVDTLADSPEPADTTNQVAPTEPGDGAQPDAVQVTGDGVLFEFQDADLSLVLNSLAAAGDLNLIYGDLPNRSVTLRLSQPVSPDQVPALLESIARSNGLSVIREGSVLRLSASGGQQDVSGQTPDSVPQRRLYVYRLQHARAARLAGTLQAIFGGGSQGSSSAFGLASPPLSQQLRSQGVPPFDPNAAPGGGADAAAAGDAGAAGGGGGAGGAAGAGPQVAGASDGLRGELTLEVQIVPEETTNSLLVRAAPEDWQIVEEAVQALDLRPLQVLIEVVIAEVSRSSDLEVGVSAEATEETDDGSVRVEVGGAGAETRGAGDLVLEVMRTGSTTVEGFLSLLATDGAVRILSRPVIFAQNNQEARILIGDERPFIQVFRSLPTDAAVRDQVVQYRDVGTALSILPTINTDGYVNLLVTQEVSTATAETQFGAPVISTREAATQLFVRDSQTVVIGGLIDRQEDRTESGVPLLKDIPLLGNLFKSQSRSIRRSELFIFLTPRIVTTDDDAARVRERLEDDADLLLPDSDEEEGTEPGLREFIEGGGEASDSVGSASDGASGPEEDPSANESPDDGPDGGDP